MLFYPNLGWWMKALYILSCFIGAALIVAAFTLDWSGLPNGWDFLIAIAGAMLLGWGHRKLDE